MEFTVTISVTDEDAGEPKSDKETVLGTLMGRIAGIDFLVDGETVYVDDVYPEGA